MFDIFQKNINTLEIKDVKSLIKEEISENQFLEYKESFPKKNKDLAKEIAAFANSKGGWIFIGIKDEDNIARELKGFKLGEGSNPERDVANKIYGLVSSNIFPLPEIAVKELELPDGNKLAVIRVFEGVNTPYTLEGTIYQRVHESSEPVKDTYSLHQIINKKDKLVKAIEKFSENSLLSYYSRPIGYSDPLVELYFYTDPEHFELPNFFTKEFKDHLKDSLGTDSWWMLDKISGFVNFQSLESSASAYIFRSTGKHAVKGANLIHPGTVFEIYSNGWAKVIILLNRYDTEQFLNPHDHGNYQYLSDFQDLLKNYQLDQLPGSVIDAYDSLLPIAILTSHYLKILRNNGFKGNINARLRLRNTDGCIIYADDKDYIEHCKTHSVISNFKELVEMPSFHSGKTATIEIKDEKEDPNGMHIGLYFLQALGIYPVLFRENVVQGFIDWLKFRNPPKSL